MTQDTPAVPLRSGWTRAAPELSPGLVEIAALVAPALPGARVVAVTPLSGGLSNTNLAVTLDRAPHRVVLRLTQHDVSQAAKEAALPALLLARGVPAARVLHAVARSRVTGGPVAVCEWIDGERLDHLAARIFGEAADGAAAGPAGRRGAAALWGLGEAVGGALAAVHRIAMPRPGFLDAALAVAQPIDLDGAALVSFLDERLLHGEGLARLGQAFASVVVAHARRHAARLDEWAGPCCLVHGDCNPSNLLLRAEGSGWAVAAMLDWEFALAAVPALDFATLLRPGVADRAGFRAGLARGYCGAGGALPRDWEAIAAIADLFAWADMLSRPGRDPAVTRDARRVMRRLLEADGKTPGGAGEQG